MSDRNKISVVVLGNGDSLKKALITNITGKDLTQLSKRNVRRELEIYENETYKFICTPDSYTQYDDVRKVLDINQQHDMCLLVVEDGFSGDKVWEQIDHLARKTGKPTDEFIVVPPVRHRGRTDYPFRCSTFEQVISELSKLAEERRPSPTNKRFDDKPEPDMSTPQTPEGMTGKYSGTTVNLVLLGLTGSGKSASGNTILRKTRFDSRVSSKPVTLVCQEAETEIEGTHVRVIDTPDIFDDDIDASVKIEHLTKCRDLCQSGPCVYLLVMHVSRFTDGERDILTKLEKAFGSNAHKQTVILFTRGDDLKHAGMSLEEFLRSCQPELKKIVEKCDNRCVVFENRDSESHQAKELMETVKMLRTTDICSICSIEDIKTDIKQRSDAKTKGGWRFLNMRRT